MKNVLILGGVSYDTIIYLRNLPEPKPMTIYSQSTHETIGSTGAGKALPLSKLGFDVTLHGIIGNDTYGEQVKKIMELNNINFLLDIDPKGTERHVNLMDQFGRRISIYTNAATFNPEVNIEAMNEKILESDVVVLNIINYCRHYIPFIKKANKEIWCDIHDFDGKNPYHHDFIQAADYIFMSSDCLEHYRDYMETLIKQNKKMVICTHGKDGLTALNAYGEWFELPIIEDYQRVDTNGE